MPKKPQPNTTPEPDSNPWDSSIDPQDSVRAEPTQSDRERIEATIQANPQVSEPEFDIEGLMNDFPTATALERFVYDQTGIVLNLKGRAQRLKYQVAMDALNGVAIDRKFIGTENPYVDRAEMVPVEELRPVPARDASLPDPSEQQNEFYTPFIPHPDPEYRARNRKVHTVFRKYRNGMISYEVLGPIEPRPVGEKMDKFGKLRPELMSWVDPRTGEQVVVRRDGTLTPQGRNLRAIMQRLKVNNSTHWDVWIDREFVTVEGGELANPWDLSRDHT